MDVAVVNLTAAAIVTHQLVTLIFLLSPCRLISVCKLFHNNPLSVILVHDPPNPIFHTITIVHDQPGIGLSQLVNNPCWSTYIIWIGQKAPGLFYEPLTYKLGVWASSGKSCVVRVFLLTSTVVALCHNNVQGVWITGCYVAVISGHENL